MHRWFENHGFRDYLIVPIDHVTRLDLCLHGKTSILVKRLKAKVNFMELVHCTEVLICRN